MANKRLAGTAYLRVDGIQQSLGGSFTINPSTINREVINGLSGPVGVKESWVTPSIEAELVKTPEMKLTSLEKVVDSTITVELADNTTVILYNACQTGELSYTGAEGTITVTWSGSMMEID